MTDGVMIYRLGSMGDTVAALPCFHLIERVYPSAERIVLTNVPVSSQAAPLEEILRPGGFVHGAIPYSLGSRSPTELGTLARRIRARGIRTLIYLAASRGLAAAWRDVAFFRVCGFTKIIGAPLSSDLQRNRIDEIGNVERESHRLARTLRQLGEIDLKDRAWWDLRLTEQEQAVAASHLRAMPAERFLALNTGGKARQKDWGLEAWTSFLTQATERLAGWGLVFLGSTEDQPRAATLAEVWPGPVLDLCGRLSPRESAAALGEAALFIGHDSGVFHLADAVGTPAVGLFGSYNKPKMWHPSGPGTRVIHRMSGLSQISSSDVLDAAVEVLGVENV